MRKKKNLPTNIACSFLLLLIMILVLVEGHDVMFGLDKDFYEKEASSGIREGDYVSLYVDGVLSNYAETTHKYYFIPIGKDQHYIVWLKNQEIISLTVQGEKRVEQLDTICDATWDYLNGASQIYDVPGKVFTGKVKKTDTELKRYMNDGLRELGVTENEFTIYSLTIDATQSALGEWILFSVVLILEVIMQFLMFKDARKEKKAQKSRTVSRLR